MKYYKIFYNTTSLKFELHEYQAFENKIATRFFTDKDTLDEIFEVIAYYSQNKDLIEVFPNRIF
jgi:hypothetical protein